MWFHWARKMTDGSQSADLQRDALLSVGVDPLNLYEDHASGKKDDRTQLVACLKGIHPGDNLLVWKLDWLGRDLRHFVNTVQEPHRRRHRAESPHRGVGGHRQDHCIGQAGVWDLRGSGRVRRTRLDLRTHHCCRPRQRPRMHRRLAIQDGPGQPTIEPGDRLGRC